jgi:hypothetical protein
MTYPLNPATLAVSGVWQPAMLLVISATLFLTVLGQLEPCPNTCWCNGGDPKNVSNIWPAGSGALCRKETCEVCSICNHDYPKCPCCNPSFGDAESCLNCRLQGTNAAVCGNPHVTYSCDHAQSQCNPEAAGGGVSK